MKKISSSGGYAAFTAGVAVMAKANARQIYNAALAASIYAPRKAAFVMTQDGEHSS
jgi:hypothetical protein